MPRRIFRILLALTLVGASLAAAAENGSGDTGGLDWYQWRGPDRNGSVPPAFEKWSWPDKPALLWRSTVGEGYSGPVVSESRVYVHSRQGIQEVVQALRLETGEVLWKQTYDAPFLQDTDARSHGRGPYSTPVVSDGRLFTLGITSILSVWEADTGRLLWRKDYADEFEWNFPYFGNASSPLVWRDRCFVHFGGHKRGGTDTPSRGAMVSLNVLSGQEIWRWQEEGPSAGASPVIAIVANQVQLIFKTLENLLALDPETGHLLWTFPYMISQGNTIVTPLLLGDKLVTSDYEFGLRAWRILRTGTEWAARPLWRNRQLSLFLSSPVLVNGQLVGFSHFRKGQVFGVDPADGSVLWRGDPRSGEHASLISWNDELLFFLEDGLLRVGQVSRSGFEESHSYRLANTRTWAHPAVTACGILIREGSDLVYHRFSNEEDCSDGLR